jgi:UDP-GlcNAc:undecaprenyl-phosphate GlcNAc-1-phosphate transferase
VRVGDFPYLFFTNLYICLTLILGYSGSYNFLFVYLTQDSRPTTNDYLNGKEGEKMWALFVISMMVSYLLTPINKKLATWLGALDLPGKRRINLEPVPTLGGLAIYGGLMVSLSSRGLLNQFESVVIGGTLIIILGIIDDLYELSPGYKLVGQLIISLSVIKLGVRIETINGMSLGILSIPATLGWLLGTINIINLIDGLDGLAGGVAVIAAAVLASFAYQQGQLMVVSLTMALIGATLGFLRYNFNPAQIFMGDTGSMFLGLMLGIISIIGALKTVTAATFLLPLLALGVPIIDTAAAIARRKLKGKAISAADQAHLHHNLLKLGLAQHQAAVIIYLITVFLGLMAVGISQANLGQGLFLLTATICFLGIGNYKTNIIRIN